MPIDHFTREQFEAALPKRKLTLPGDPEHCWSVVGVQDGEYCYHIPICGGYGQTWIQVRSSIGVDGVSAGVGEDSIRLWLMSPTGPVASKLTKYVTRVKGWEGRMTTQLRTLYKIGLALKPCPRCGDLMHAFIAGKGKESQAQEQNKGRVFQKCVRPNARGLKLHGCQGAFEWIEFKEGKMTHTSKNWVKFNINSAVRIKLLPKGLENLKRHWSVALRPGDTVERVLSTVHPEWRTGYITLQMWQLFEYFGGSTSMGIALDFETTIELDGTEMTGYQPSTAATLPG